MTNPEYRKYMYRYTYNKKDYAFDLYAKSEEEAEQRLRAIKSNGKLVGKVGITEEERKRLALERQYEYENF